MENGPAIVLFWYGAIFIFILAVFLIIASIVLKIKGKRENKKKYRFWGRICLVLGIVCLTPVFMAIGLVMYYYFGLRIYHYNH